MSANENTNMQYCQHVMPHPPPKAPHGSTAFLDGLRGLAALFGFIQHYIGSFDANVHEHGFGEGGNYYLASLPFLRIVFNGGSAAVTIFFVLSGYVLSKSPLGLLRNGKRQATLSLASAIIRRPIRLYIPPLGTTLAFAILMHAPFGLVPDMGWPQPKATVFAEIAYWPWESIKFFNPFQTHGSGRAWYPYNLVVWTIPIELKGSMLVYGLTAIAALSGSPRSLSLVI
jgi:peptidoglycan/LPS O-acetylase OafA/YrhL